MQIKGIFILELQQFGDWDPLASLLWRQIDAQLAGQIKCSLFTLVIRVMVLETSFIHSNNTCSPRYHSKSALPNSDGPSYQH
ncbi:hypothetical protein CEXT_640301 [Caerostris extrusa]|uniref:Uncharacterized protein n=1 Tax=Caerostris extrusa TaxID=172846 RepID=A0AAV4U1D0_CAEEX|nr:hypothetical protein CEXT_640301 [Caerostris extrusa]